MSRIRRVETRPIFDPLLRLTCKTGTDKSIFGNANNRPDTQSWARGLSKYSESGKSSEGLSPIII